MRKNSGKYKSFVGHMSRLRLFLKDKHFVQACEIIKAYWALKGETKLPNAVEASLFGKDGSKCAGMMANVHANSVAGTANVLECHHKTVRKLYASEVVKLLKDRGEDIQAAERARRPKLNLADFGKVIIQEVIPKLAEFSTNESFDKLSQTQTKTGTERQQVCRATS